MKFKLYSELLSESDIMSHVFLNCLSDGGKDIAKETERLSLLHGKEWVNKNREIDICLTIEGKEYSPKNFFNMFSEQFERMLKEEATKMVKEQTSDKIDAFNDKIQEMSDIINTWSEEINWNTENVFLKPITNE